MNIIPQQEGKQCVSALKVDYLKLIFFVSPSVQFSGLTSADAFILWCLYLDVQLLFSVDTVAVPLGEDQRNSESGGVADQCDKEALSNDQRQELAGEVRVREVWKNVRAGLLQIGWTGRRPVLTVLPGSLDVRPTRLHHNESQEATAG